MPVESSVRERRRAETVHEIKQAALQQLAEAGPGGMSLRGVARAVGMTVQSLYHYFDNRDALLTVLVHDAHHAMADAVQASADATRGRSSRHRRLAAASAYREWAHANRPAFLLIYGTPVPGFEPLPESGTGLAAWRLAAPFSEVVFDGWTPAELASVALPTGGEPIASALADGGPPLPAGAEGPPRGAELPPGAMALFIELRARMHGLVVLELLGHLHPLQDHAAALFAAAMNRMSDEVDAQRGTGGVPAPPVAPDDLPWTA